MNKELSSRVVGIYCEDQSLGSGILATSTGLIASCFHNFHRNDDQETDLVIHKIYTRSDGHWDEIQYSKNVIAAVPEHEMDNFKYYDAYLIRCDKHFKISQIEVCNKNLEVGNSVWIVSYDPQLPGDTSIILSKITHIAHQSQKTSKRLWLSEHVHEGYSGSGVFTTDGKLCGILTHMAKDRVNKPIASYLPDGLIEMINKDR